MVEPKYMPVQGMVLGSAGGVLAIKGCSEAQRRQARVRHTTCEPV